jgi:phage terminase large subunit
MYGEIRGLVFPNWEIVQAFPDDCKKVFYGKDFGYTNDPTTLIKIGLHKGGLYFKELIYKTGMLNSDIIESYEALNLNRRGKSNPATIWADSADPKSIAEIYKGGYNIKAAKKGADSIKYGISLIKQYPIFITSDSPNLIKEAQSYKWAVDKNGKTLNKPIDFYNHCWDAVRYGCVMSLKKRGGIKFM